MVIEYIEIGCLLLNVTGLILIFLLLHRIRKTYGIYRLWIYTLFSTILLSIGLFFIFNISAKLIPSIPLSQFSYSVAIWIFNLVLALFVLYFHLQTSPRIPIGTIIALIALLFLKGYFLAIEPTHIMRGYWTNIRFTHSSLPSLTISMTLIFILIAEYSQFFRALIKTPTKLNKLFFLTLSYLSVLISLPTILIMCALLIQDFTAPLIEEIILSFIVILLYIYGSKDLSMLFMGPHEIRSFLMHTYGGLQIVSKNLIQEPLIIKRPARELSIEHSFIAVLIEIGELLEERRTLTEIFRSQRLGELRIIMYFGRLVIGSFVSQSDCFFIRDLLKNMVKDYEAALGDRDLYVIHDEHIILGEKIYEKYLPALLSL